VRVAIDIQSLLRQKTGVGHALYDLIEAIAALEAPETITAFYFARRRRRLALAFGHDRFREQQISFPPARLLTGLWKRLPFPAIDRFLDEADLYHFPDFVTRPVRRGKVIVTIHDLSFARLPETVEPRNRAYLARKVPASLERADTVIAVSDFTRHETEALFPVSRGKVHVIHHGVRRSFRPRSPNENTTSSVPVELPRRYILAVGTVEPRKNLGLLLDAMSVLRRHSDSRHVGLVVVGGRGWLADDTEQRLAAEQQQGRLVRTGYVPDDTLRRLYCGASALAFPTKYEGFGLPAIEAMACGLPVVCSKAASLPEVVGDAGILVEEHTAEAFADALGRVLADEALTAELRRRGLERAAEFTWEKAARHTLDLYRHVVGGTDADRH